MKYGKIISEYFCGDAEVKFEKSAILFSKHGKELAQNTEVQRQIVLLRERQFVLDNHMAAMEMGRTCADCAMGLAGGCCSAYMGNENTDALLLLMNILADVNIRMIRGIDEEECCFLAETGCVLLIKPIFCLNYLCGRIQREANKKQLRLLDEKAGALLTAQAELEQLLILFLQSQEE